MTGLLPDAAALAQLFGRLGISPRHHVVIVGAGNGPADFTAAARVYWTLKTAGHRAVSILDGGMAAWCAEPARSLESGEARPPAPTTYPVAIDHTWRSDTAAVATALENGRAVLLDSRSSPFFLWQKRVRKPPVRVACRAPISSTTPPPSIRWGGCGLRRSF